VTALLLAVDPVAPVEAARRSAADTLRPQPPGPTTLERARGIDSAPAHRIEAARASARRAGEVNVVGGDDVVIDTIDLDASSLNFVQLAEAENGDLYSAVAVSPTQTLIRRSTDDGQTWEVIGDISAIDPQSKELQTLHVVDGSVDRLYVFYRATDAGGPEGGVLYDDLRVAYAELGVASPTWAFSTVMDPDMVGIGQPSVADDSEEFPDAWIYVVARGDGPGDIWFSRSVDGGVTWTPPVQLLVPAAGGLETYQFPRIAYGREGRLHVVSTYSRFVDDASARYIRSLKRE
jgi:hypothetical protein